MIAHNPETWDSPSMDEFSPSRSFDTAFQVPFMAGGVCRQERLYIAGKSPTLYS
jgi:hypothetical protein